MNRASHQQSLNSAPDPTTQSVFSQPIYIYCIGLGLYGHINPEPNLNAMDKRSMFMRLDGQNMCDSERCMFIIALLISKKTNHILL